MEFGKSCAESTCGCLMLIIMCTVMIMVLMAMFG